MLTHSLLYPQYLHFQNSTTTLINIPIQRKYNLLLTLHKMIQPNWRQCVFSYVSFINTFMEAKDTRFLIKSFSSGMKKLLKGSIVILPSLRVRKVLFFSSFFTSDFFQSNFVFSSTKQLCKFAEHCKRSNQYSPQCNLSKEESLSRPHFLIACLRWLARYLCLSINNSVLSMYTTETCVGVRCKSHLYSYFGRLIQDPFFGWCSVSFCFVWPRTYHFIDVRTITTIAANPTTSDRCRPHSNENSLLFASLQSCLDPFNTFSSFFK